MTKLLVQMRVSSLMMKVIDCNLSLARRQQHELKMIATFHQSAMFQLPQDFCLSTDVLKLRCKSGKVCHVHKHMLSCMSTFTSSISRVI